MTTPVFGSDVVYDCPNSKLIEQKKFIKFGLSQAALEAHVPLIEKEVEDYLAMSPNFHGTSGEVDIPAAMAEITIFTAGSALQGEEVRSKLTTEFAVLYHDLDKGFTRLTSCYPGPPSRIIRNAMLPMLGCVLSTLILSTSGEMPVTTSRRS